MRGITEERLLDILRSYEPQRDTKASLMEKITSQCTELNPWQPIDENTPKDRCLLLYSPGIEGVSKKFVGKLESCWYWNPTHWQELPEDLK